MLYGKKIVCIIPARLHSVRFPKKILAFLADQPLLAWVWQAATKVPFFDEVFFAIDAEETAFLIEQFGGKYHMTSPLCESGTDRIIELQQKKIVHADIWVNWQGDEPFINTAMIETLLQSCNQSNEECWTLKKKIDVLSQIQAKNIAKVVADKSGNALYFSRSPIPCYRDNDINQEYYKHVGLYAFADSLIPKLATLPLGTLEQAEKLEQLRLLESGIKIRLHETNQEVMGIDTLDDLHQAELRIKNSPSHI